MRILILILFFPLFVSGQSMSYIESNFGIADVSDDWNGYFPGTSILIGRRVELQNNFIMDIEAGLALPSIVTGKIGVGYYLSKKSKAAIVGGVRPWPLHVYGQINLPERKLGQWTVSAELGTGKYESLYSSHILNFGYRWMLNKRKILKRREKL